MTETARNGPSRSVNHPCGGTAFPHGFESALIDLMPAAVYVCEAPSGVVLRYNRRAAELWGREPVPGDTQERFCGSHRLYLPDGTPLPHADCPMADVLLTGEPVCDQEVVVERPDGTRITALVNIAVVRGPGGEVVGAVNVFQDITGRKRAEEASARSEAWLRRVLERMPAGAYTCDPDGLITAFNRKAVELWGREPLLNDPADRYCGSFKLFASDGSAISHDGCWMALALRDGAEYAEREIVIERPDGTRRTALAHASPIRDANGRLLGAVNVLVDITERKRSEEALRASEARYRAIVESTPECVKLVAADGTLLQMNRAGLVMLEADESAVGGCVYDVIAPEDRDRFRAFNERVCRGEGGSLEFDVVGRAGTRRNMETTAVPLPEPAGGFDHLAVTRDVTTRRREAEFLDGQKCVLELIARGAARPEVLAALCRLVEAQSGGEMLASILLCADGQLRHGAGPSLPDAYTRAIDGVAIGPAVGSCGTAAFRGEPVYVADIAADPLWADFRDLALGHGLRACWSQPILAADGVLGTFAMYYRAPRSPAPGDLRLVELVTRTAAIAIERDRAAEAERRLHAEVEAERARLEEVFRLAPSFVAVHRGPDHVFERANDRYARLTGGRRLIGLPVREALPEVEGQGFFEVLDRVYRTGEPFVATDARVRLRQGPDGSPEERVVEFVYQPLRDAAGAVTGVLAHGVDLTDRVRAEEGLARVTAESERRKRLYETALSNTPDLVYVFDLDHRFAYANEALLGMWGRTWDEAIGRTCLELGYPDWHASMHDREIEQVKATRKPVRGEVPFTGTSGRRVYDYIFVPVLGAGGEVEAVAGTTRDVTDRKRDEEALREADRRKDEFLALLAHELRNPLAPIRNGLQLLRLADGDADARGRARQMMDRQLTHLVRLVDDLLDVSRITRGKMELRRSRIPLAEVVGSAVEAARPLLDAARHELTVTTPGGGVVLDADPVRLSQVLSNLLTNSAKYTPPGGRIRLEAARDGGGLVVTVRDTGVGIPADALPRIFDMFSQVDRSIEKSTGGLGIGLALVKGLVEMHGGTVTAASEGEGRGSTFTVRLPVAEDRPVSAAPPADEHSRGGAARRILVVDDNRDGAESLADMLRLLGHEVHTAHDGLEAVAAAGRLRPELILMDVGMPRLNGLDATRRIREEPWGPSVAVVALTGWGQEGDRERSREAGCNGHLVKPVSLPDLEIVLAEVERSH